MYPKGNRPRTKWSTLAWIGAINAAMSCTVTYAQRDDGARTRSNVGERPVQAERPRLPGRGFGPRGGPGGSGLQGPVGRSRPWSEVPEPERRQVERFMEEHFPSLYVEMQRLNDRDEFRYARRMTRIAPQMRKIMETMRTEPQRGALMIRERQLEFEILQTVARFRGAQDDAAKSRIRARLEELFGKSFDCRNERRQLEVRELEARLSELRARLSESERMRPALIRRRLSELLERPAPPPDDDENLNPEDRPEEPPPESE